MVQAVPQELIMEDYKLVKKLLEILVLILVELELVVERLLVQALSQELILEDYNLVKQLLEILEFI